ncbi:hypothetical protein Sjap_004036 [Stephania japonica]|uniref:Myb-like domain-containing protein n=1 Tax=Stephania japonica TaxID=461633 RepID=A0AAP0K1I9_9MAGN
MMLGGSGDGDALSRIGMISAVLAPQMNISGDVPATKKDDRVPQWSHQEMREFIAIRAELERDFTVAKRNKTLWQVVSGKMKERGYVRSPDQCKCKWKNLVNRYKGKETSDPENGRQCPFFDELHAVFTERAKNMQRMLQESEHAGAAQVKKKTKGRAFGQAGDRSSDEFSDEEDDGEDDSDEDRLQPQQQQRSNRKRKAERERPQRNVAAAALKSGGGLVETLQEFLLQQQRNEVEWREMMERRAAERRVFEEEWRRSMEKMERERLIVEQAWREREEQRRMREETRAEKRDAMLTTLLTKLIQGDRL